MANHTFFAGCVDQADVAARRAYQPDRFAEDHLEKISDFCRRLLDQLGNRLILPFAAHDFLFFFLAALDLRCQ